jgi:hypothetical protein
LPITEPPATTPLLIVQSTMVPALFCYKMSLVPEPVKSPIPTML